MRKLLWVCLMMASLMTVDLSMVTTVHAQSRDSPSHRLIPRDRNAKAPTPHSSRGFGLFDLLGGWPALGGVAMAGITGLWIGIAPPASVEALSAQVFGTTDSVSLMGEASVWTELDVTDG